LKCGGTVLDLILWARLHFMVIVVLCIEEWPHRKAVCNCLFTLNRALSKNSLLNICANMHGSVNSTRLQQAGIFVGYRLLRKVSSKCLIDPLELFMMLWGLGRSAAIRSLLKSEYSSPLKAPHGCWEVNNMEMSLIV
jgi:hypothetical protein